MGLAGRSGRFSLTCTLSFWPPFACAGRRKSLFSSSGVCSPEGSRLWAFSEARGTRSVVSSRGAHPVPQRVKEPFVSPCSFDFARSIVAFDVDESRSWLTISLEFFSQSGPPPSRTSSCEGI